MAPTGNRARNIGIQLPLMLKVISQPDIARVHRGIQAPSYMQHVRAKASETVFGQILARLKVFCFIRSEHGRTHLPAQMGLGSAQICFDSCLFLCSLRICTAPSARLVWLIARGTDLIKPASLNRKSEYQHAGVLHPVHSDIVSDARSHQSRLVSSRLPLVIDRHF